MRCSSAPRRSMPTTGAFLFWMPSRLSLRPVLHSNNLTPATSSSRWLHKSDKIRVGDWEGADGLTRRMSFLVPYQAPRWFKRAVGAARPRALCKEREPLLFSQLWPPQELQ